MRPDLAGFLLARIAEDEALAREATPGRWTHNPRKEWFTDPDKLRAAHAGIQQSGAEEFVGADGVGVAATGPSGNRQSMIDADHIARYDPARVLAECEAKRRIVVAARRYDLDPEGVRAAMSDGDEGPYVADLALKALTPPYADHPDYHEEWQA